MRIRKKFRIRKRFRIRESRSISLRYGTAPRMAEASGVFSIKILLILHGRLPFQKFNTVVWKTAKKRRERNEYKDYDAVREKMGVRAVVQIGMLAAVAVILMLFEIPLPFAPSFIRSTSVKSRCLWDALQWDRLPEH